MRRHADQGKVWAYYEIACRYDKGRGVPVNVAKAIEWYRKAGDHGIVCAYHALGECYQLGLGVPQSYPSAWEWYTKALKAGFALSQYNCGMMFFTGRGVDHISITEGVRLIRLSADQGVALAQEQLAKCYSHGYGVEASLRLAITWRLKAAKQNQDEAQTNMFQSLLQLHYGERAWREHYGDATTPAAPPGSRLELRASHAYPPSGIYWLRMATAQGSAAAAKQLADVEEAIDCICANCRVEGGKFRCKRCLSVSYCSKSCQRNHWKKRHHKSLCCDNDMDINDFQVHWDNYTILGGFKEG